MKKNYFFKKILLSIACLLGTGGVLTSASLNKKSSFSEQPDSAFATLASITLSDIISNPAGVGDWTWEGNSLVLEDGMIKFQNGDYFQLNYNGDDFADIERYKGSIHARKADGTDISWYIWICTYDTYEGEVKKRNGTQHGDANSFKVYQHFFETSFLRILAESYGGGSEIWIDSLTIEAQAYHAVYATGDEGCKSVYLSSRDDGYRPHEKTRDSGTRYYEPGTAVYTFAVMKEGYVPVTEYEAKLSTAADGTEGNLYRITHATITGNADYYFDEVETKSLNAKVLIEGTNPGISEVYLSTDENAMSGSASGSTFGLNITVYGFVVLNTDGGYEPLDDWTQIGTSNHYRVSSIETTDSNDKDMGVFGPKCKIKLYNGAEMVDTLYVVEGQSVNNLTTSQIPSKDGYTFIGYYSTKDTGGDNYFNADGTSNIVEWNGGASVVYAYARYTEDMTVTINNYEGDYDDNPHTISVTVSKPTSNYQLVFEATGTNVPPQYTESGTYPVNFTISADNYTTYNGQGTIKINKADSVLSHVPNAKTGLTYTDQDYDLITAGSVDYGTLLYAVSDKLEVPSATSFSETIPTGHNVGTYYVFYKTTGDDNHKAIEASTQNAIEVKIARVDRTEAININKAAKDYEDILDDRFTTIKDSLESTRSTFELEAITEDNITAEAVALKVVDMQTALSEAKVAVTEQLINMIGTVVYPDSKDAIIEAYDHYTNVLNDTEKAMVNAELKALLDEDKALYDAVDAMAKLITNLPKPAESKAYYDAVDEAKVAYDNLIEKQLSTLQNATDFNYEKKLLDNVAARAVIELIDVIDEVTYNAGVDDSKSKIEAAEEAYLALTDDQKELVVNYKTLTRARRIYDNVHNSVELIRAIGEVKNTKESKNKIDTARVSYNKLSEVEKSLVKGYNNSYKTLDDDEHVYEALVLIDEIGQVAYDTDPEGRIDRARKYYNNLTEDQKSQVGDTYLNTLVTAEDDSAYITRVNVTWLVIGLILSILIIGGGSFYIFFLLKRKKDDDDKKKNGQVKAMSVGGLLSIVILISHYYDALWIILYILAPIAAIVLIACIVLFILNRKKMWIFASKPEEKETIVSNNEDDEEVVTATDEKGNIFQIRYVKSFTAKLIQSPDVTKQYYEELKNEVLSYNKTTSRVSWHYDSINSGRNQVLKFAIRGKTLCVYYPLNADDYIDSKYKVEKSESKKYESVPCLYRIKNDRRLGYAKELIRVVCERLGLVKGEDQHEVYSNLPYEENKPLIARGLIKELKVQVNKPQEEILESHTNVEGDEIVAKKDSKGNIFQIRYVKSFIAKLSQASDETKNYYNILKNYALSYKKANSRISWHYDSINVGRDKVLKFSIRGKTLCVYYALNDEDFAESKYKVEKSETKKYEDVPCLYRIKNDRRFNYAKDLIDIVMNKLGTNEIQEFNEDFRIPYEETSALLEKGLIKELKVKIISEEQVSSITAEEADTMMSDETAEAQIIEEEVRNQRQGKKEVINIDTLSANFNNGDEVNIDILIKKKLVPAKTARVKVLARGTLDKRLNVVLDDYSIQAVKMIILLEGTVKKVR